MLNKTIEESSIIILNGKQLVYSVEHKIWVFLNIVLAKYSCNLDVGHAPSMGTAINKTDLLLEIQEKVSSIVNN